MLVCKNCNGQLEDGVKFCKFCGSKIESTDNLELDNGSAVAEVLEKPASSKVGSGSKNVIFKIVPIVLIIIAAFVLVPKLFGSTDTSDLVLYVKDDEINYINLKKMEPIELTEELYKGGNTNDLYSYEYYSYDIHISNDGKRILYPDKYDDSYRYTLYLSNLKDKDAERQKIDSEISYYVVNDDTTKIFYIKGSSGNLYVHDLNDKTKIESDVSNFFINSDGTKILILNNDGELYLKSEGKDKEKIASDSSIINVSDDLSKIYYMKDNVIYRKEEGNDKVKIDSDVDYVVMSTDSDEIYYVKPDDVEKKLYEYVIDDLKVSDASITDPGMFAEENLYSMIPDYYDYDTYEEYEIAVESYNDHVKDYKKMKEDHNKVYNLYREKLGRDDLREYLQKETITIYSDTLYYYNGKESVVITENYGFKSDEYYNNDNGAMVYSKNTNSEVKKIKLQDIDYYDEVYDMAQSSITYETEAYAVINGKISLIEDVDNSKSYGFTFNEALTKLYYSTYTDDSYEQKDLYEIKISNNSLEKPVLYAEDIEEYYLRNDSIVYLADNDGNGNCDLYVNDTKVDSDVALYKIKFIEDTGAFTYYTDYSRDKYYGTLKVYDGSSTEKIADDVYSELPINADKIVYLIDYNTNKARGDAYLYNGSDKKVLVDEDVTKLIKPFK